MSDPVNFDFDEYIRQSEPEKQQKGYIWQTAIGLQDVDGLKPSEYLIETAKKNIDGVATTRARPRALTRRTVPKKQIRYPPALLRFSRKTPLFSRLNSSSRFIADSLRVSTNSPEISAITTSQKKSGCSKASRWFMPVPT